MRTYLLIILVWILLSASGCSLWQGSTPDDFTGEDYTVLSSMLENSRDFILGGNFQIVLLEDKTGLHEQPEQLRQQLRTLQQDASWLSSDLIDALIKRNSQVYPLEEKLQISFNYTLISQEEIDSLVALGSGPDCQRAVEARFPGASGILTISRPGFNASGNLALVYVGGGLCKSGAGYFVLMEKDGDSWKISERTLAWIS